MSKPTQLDELKFAVNCAAMEAMDEKLQELLPQFKRKVWITDKLVPRLIPHLEAVTELALREVYDLLPESMDFDPDFVAKTRQQLNDSLDRVAALKRQGG